MLSSGTSVGLKERKFQDIADVGQPTKLIKPEPVPTTTDSTHTNLNNNIVYYDKSQPPPEKKFESQQLIGFTLNDNILKTDDGKLLAYVNNEWKEYPLKDEKKAIADAKLSKAKDEASSQESVKAWLELIRPDNDLIEDFIDISKVPNARTFAEFYKGYNKLPEYVNTIRLKRGYSLKESDIYRHFYNQMYAAKIGTILRKLKIPYPPTKTLRQGIPSIVPVVESTLMTAGVDFVAAGGALLGIDVPGGPAVPRTPEFKNLDDAEKWLLGESEVNGYTVSRFIEQGGKLSLELLLKMKLLIQQKQSGMEDLKRDWAITRRQTAINSLNEIAYRSRRLQEGVSRQDIEREIKEGNVNINEVEEAYKASQREFKQGLETGQISQNFITENLRDPDQLKRVLSRVNLLNEVLAYLLTSYSTSYAVRSGAEDEKQMIAQNRIYAIINKFVPTAPEIPRIMTEGYQRRYAEYLNDLVNYINRLDSVIRIFNRYNISIPNEDNEFNRRMTYRQIDQIKDPEEVKRLQDAIRQFILSSGRGLSTAEVELFRVPEVKRGESQEVQPSLIAMLDDYKDLAIRAIEEVITSNDSNNAQQNRVNAIRVWEEFKSHINNQLYRLGSIPDVERANIMWQMFLEEFSMTMAKQNFNPQLIKIGLARVVSILQENEPSLKRIITEQMFDIAADLGISIYNRNRVSTADRLIQGYRSVSEVAVNRMPEILQNLPSSLQNFPREVKSYVDMKIIERKSEVQREFKEITPLEIEQEIDLMADEAKRTAVRWGGYRVMYEKPLRDAKPSFLRSVIDKFRRNHSAQEIKEAEEFFENDADDLYEASIADSVRSFDSDDSDAVYIENLSSGERRRLSIDAWIRFLKRVGVIAGAISAIYKALRVGGPDAWEPFPPLPGPDGPPPVGPSGPQPPGGPPFPDGKIPPNIIDPMNPSKPETVITPAPITNADNLTEGMERIYAIDPAEAELFLISKKQQEAEDRAWNEYSFVASGNGLGTVRTNALLRKEALQNMARFKNNIRRVPEYPTTDQIYLGQKDFQATRVNFGHDDNKAIHWIPVYQNSYGKEHWEDAYVNPYIKDKKILWTNPYANTNNTRYDRANGMLTPNIENPDVALYHKGFADPNYKPVNEGQVNRPPFYFGLNKQESPDHPNQKFNAVNLEKNSNVLKSPFQFGDTYHEEFGNAANTKIKNPYRNISKYQLAKKG